MRSALKAGYAQEYAEKITAVMSEEVRTSITDAMDRAGLTDERLVDVLKDGLEANRVVSALVMKSRPSNVDEEMAAANQNTHDFIEVPDHPTRHKFLDTAIKLKGSYAAERHEHTGKDGEALNLVFVKKETDLPPEDAPPDHQAQP